MADIKTEVELLEKTQKEVQDKQAELEKVKAATSDYESRKTALNLELERVTKDITTAKEERRKKDESFEEKFSKEQFQKASDKFFAKFKYEPDAQKTLIAKYEKVKSGSMDAELIFSDLMAAHVSLNPQKYVEMEERVGMLTQKSEEFKAAMSSAAGAGSGFSVRTEDNALTPDEIKAAQWAGILPETYKRLKSEGKI